jgi:ribonuclease Z
VIEPQALLGEERKGLKVSYCTDTRPTADLVDFIHNSDLFICEGMYGDEDKYQKAVEKKHMLFSEAARLATEGKGKEMWLTHYSPSIFNPEDYLSKVREIFSNTVAGKDLMVKKLNFKD